MLSKYVRGIRTCYFVFMSWKMASGSSGVFMRFQKSIFFHVFLLVFVLFADTGRVMIWEWNMFTLFSCCKHEVCWERNKAISSWFFTLFFKLLLFKVAHREYHSFLVISIELARFHQLQLLIWGIKKQNYFK